MAPMCMTPRGFWLLVVVPLVFCLHGIIGVNDLLTAAVPAVGLAAQYCPQDAWVQVLAASVASWALLLAVKEMVVSMRDFKPLTRQEMHDVAETCLKVSLIACLFVGLRSGLLGACLCSTASKLVSVGLRSGSNATAMSVSVGSLFLWARQEATSPAASQGGWAGNKRESMSFRSYAECDYDVIGVTCTAK